MNAKAASAPDTLESVRAKIAKLSPEEQARTKAYATQAKETLQQEPPWSIENKSLVRPLYLAHANERVACVEHLWWRKKNSPPGLAKMIRVVQVGAFYFDEETGTMVRPEQLNVYYKLHESHRRQYELYEYDVIVLLAISTRGARNFFQVESELASRVQKDGSIATVERNELYESLVRIQRAKLWTLGELPKPRKGKGVNEPMFQPKEVSASRNY